MTCMLFLDNQIVTASKRTRKRTGRYYKSGYEKESPRRTPGFLAKKKKKKKYIYIYIYTHTHISLCLTKTSCYIFYINSKIIPYTIIS